MAPTFRSSRSGRQFGESTTRTRSGAAEHDIFEGLPIRRWTRQNHTVSQDTKIEIPDNTPNNVKSDQPFPELPMPKDSHMLPPHSRALLRAARAGYIYLRPATKDTQPVDDKDAHDMDESAQAAKMERSYTTRKWSQIPRHVELPEVEFLAKRRVGLPSLYGASGAVTAAIPNASQPMRKAKIRKVDPETGNITIYDVWIPEGQKMEGEIKDESQAVSSAAQQDVVVTKATPAPGTVVEGLGVANAEGIVVASTAAEPSPTKRKGPPPPKRKGKGLRGKWRKKVMFAPGEGAEAGGEDQMAVDGEQDEEDEEEEDGEEDAEGTEDIIKTDNETPQADTVMKDQAPKLDLDATPSLPPSTQNIPSTQESQPLETTNTGPTAPKEQPQDIPQSSTQPQSEQPAPPDVPATTSETITTDQESREEVKPEPDVQDHKPIPDPSSVDADTDMMEDVQHTELIPQPVEPEVPPVEEAEVTEPIQSAGDGLEAIQTETEAAPTEQPADKDNVDQKLETAAPIESEPSIEPPPTTTDVPEPSSDLPDTLQSSLEEPKQSAEETSQVKIEQEDSTTTTAITTTAVEAPIELAAVPPPPSEPNPDPTESEVKPEIPPPETALESEIIAPEPVPVPALTEEQSTEKNILNQNESASTDLLIETEEVVASEPEPAPTVAPTTVADNTAETPDQPNPPS